ncbi:hypothetical protein ABZ345_11820 [Lentzea sp. NPDC005914]|uniref:hypothetical protein n=1 Tax=Lentzea sp. NPDC005914 TaxID=3154572 RepID=UPI0033F9255F
MAVIITVVLALLGSTAPAIATPQQFSPRQVTAADEPPPEPVDEEYEFYKQLVQDIADHAEDVEVRDAATAALAVGTKEKLVWFLDHGQAEAKARADQRKAAENAENRKKVQEWARTGGPNVRADAQAALDAGDRAIRNFVAFGYEIALKKDRQQAEDDKAEQDRTIARVRDMVAMGGPQVKIEGEAALATRDYAVIREFYMTGYQVANQRDHDLEAVILKALEDRNKAVTELDQLARKWEEAAKARAEIMRANIDAVQTLEDGVYAMQRALKAAHRADEIFREDKPGRAHGQLGRNEDIDVQRARATEEAASAARIAERAQEAVIRAQNAAIRLVDNGMTDGREWAKVAFGVGNAVQAMALAAKTSQHAAEATLADSRALDADRNAQEHAENAKKYLEEAKRQEQKAIELANAAQIQHDIALAARDRAKAQKDLAAAKANQAKSHAASARTHRVNAQNAAANANATAQAAIEANNNAIKHKINMDAAIARRDAIAKDVDRSEKIFGKHVSAYNQLQRDLAVAKKKAEENGGTAWDEYHAIERETNAAKASADQAEGWANRARESAAAAQAEAAAATQAANEANAAAVRAGKAATEARRAADDTHRLALESASAAIATKDAAEKVRSEAEESMTEANEAVYQSVVADRAASAASAAAQLMVDPASVAESVLRPLAAINADARRALKAVSEALVIGEEQSRAARDKAAEAAAAAIHARKVADEAEATIKPALVAAANAADAANRAAGLAVEANDAANAAAQYAGDASKSAVTASQWAGSARADAATAGNAANAAAASAATARSAAEQAENIRAWAFNTATKLTEFKDKIAERLSQVTDINERYREALRLAQEAQAKREEMNRQTVEGMIGLLQCTRNLNGPACKKLRDWAGDKIGAGVDAATRHFTDAGECVANGNKEACDRFTQDLKNIAQFQVDIAIGFGEAAISPVMSIIEVSKCAYQGVAESDWSKCWDMLAEVKYNLTNPYTWINLEEWQTRPGKALGGTVFDLGVTALTFETGGTGGAVWKAVRTVARKVDGGTGRLSNKLAELDAFAVKLHQSFRDVLRDSVGDIPGLRLLFDGDKAKFDSSIAIVDGKLYRVEPFEVNVPGGTNLPNGTKVRLEGGTLKLENGVAKVEDAQVRTEPPKTCVASVMARAAADPGCGPNGPDPADVPDRTTDGAIGSNGDYKQSVDLAYVQNERGDNLSLGFLPIEVSKKDIEWLVENRVKRAKAAEPEVTPIIERIARDKGRNEGLDTKFKDANPVKDEHGNPIEGMPSASSLRKFFEERMPDKPLSEGGRWKTPDEVQKKMNDSLRYTIVYPDKDYTNQTQKAINQLRDEFGAPVKFSNFWPEQVGGAYAGINITFTAKNGLPFEVQFHTDDSYKAKSDEHGNYDKKRKLRAALEYLKVREMPKDERTTWTDLLETAIEAKNQEAKAFFNKIEPPLNAHKIKP